MVEPDRYNGDKIHFRYYSSMNIIDVAVIRIFYQLIIDRVRVNNLLFGIVPFGTY